MVNWIPYSLLNHFLFFLFVSQQTIKLDAFVTPFRSNKYSLPNQHTTMTSVDSLMIETYERLSEKVLKAVNDRSDDRQYWICLAGGPGAGKSTLSAAVVKRLNHLAGSDDYSVVLPMDGFHYSRAELRKLSEKPGSPSFEELLARRGSPWTFDANSVCSALSKARSLKSGSLPTYSRAISDPVPGGVELLKEHKVVIVEGNYMLNYDDPLWSPLKELFDEKWYVSCGSIEVQRTRLIQRHLETWSEEKTKMWGEGVVGASKKADANDVLNAQYIVQSAKYADTIIESL